MFTGEIIAINTLGVIPCIMFACYVLDKVSRNEIFTIDSFVVNSTVILISIAIMYIFNLIIGLLPVYNTIRKTPASILARHDLDWFFKDKYIEKLFEEKILRLDK